VGGTLSAISVIADSLWVDLLLSFRKKPALSGGGLLLAGGSPSFGDFRRGFSSSFGGERHSKRFLGLCGRLLRRIVTNASLRIQGQAFSLSGKKTKTFRGKRKIYLFAGYGGRPPFPSRPQEASNTVPPEEKKKPSFHPHAGHLRKKKNRRHPKRDARKHVPGRIGKGLKTRGGEKNSHSLPRRGHPAKKSPFPVRTVQQGCGPAQVHGRKRVTARTGEGKTNPIPETGETTLFSSPYGKRPSVASSYRREKRKIISFSHAS